MADASTPARTLPEPATATKQSAAMPRTQRTLSTRADAAPAPALQRSAGGPVGKWGRRQVDLPVDPGDRPLMGLEHLPGPLGQTDLVTRPTGHEPIREGRPATRPIRSTSAAAYTMRRRELVRPCGSGPCARGRCSASLCGDWTCPAPDGSRRCVDQIQSAQYHQSAADLLQDDGALGLLVPVQVPLHQFGGGAGHDDHRAVPDAVDGQQERAVTRGACRRCGRSRPASGPCRRTCTGRGRRRRPGRG